MHSKLLAPAWRWTIKAMIKAGLLPHIGHYDLHLHDQPCDAVRGTPLARMRRLKGWQRVDQSKPPAVPRGIVEGLFDPSFIDQESRRSSPAKEPHSSLSASEWFQCQTGHPVPSNLRSKEDVLATLQHPDVVHTGGDTGALHTATGILATSGTIAAPPHVLHARNNLHANLSQGNHAQLQAQLSATAVSWQTSSASTFAADPTTNLGRSAPLPAAMASGSVSGSGVVEVEVYGGDDIDNVEEAPVLAATSSTRKQKEGARQKKRRMNPEVRERENAMRKWNTYKKKHGGTIEFDAWKSAGSPLHPPP